MNDPNTIYTKTAKGVMALKHGDKSLPRTLLPALTLVDGRSTVHELLSTLPDDVGARRVTELKALETLGFIRVFFHAAYTAQENRTGHDRPTVSAAAENYQPLEVTEHEAQEGVRLWAEAHRVARELESKGFFAPPRAARATPAGTGHGLSVLVVEDVASIAQLLAAYLSKRGFKVQIVGDGRDAIEVLDGEPLPDLVLLDVNLPSVNGFDVLEYMRSQRRLTLIPAIMVTARVDEADVLRGLKGDADGYIFKPFEWSALYACIASVLKLDA